MEHSLAADRRTRLLFTGLFTLAVVAGWVISSPWSTPTVRALTCALGAVLVLLAHFGSGLSSRRRLLTGALVAWCGASLGWTVVRPLAELPSGEGVRAWSFFHYYLGAKYFPEVGYTGLYDQVLAADGDGEHLFKHVRSLRNLETYAVEHRDRRERWPGWSDARWRELQSDLAVLEPYASQRTWRRIFRDRGYNPPPSFTALRRVFGFDLSPTSLVIVASLDAIALLVAFVLAGRVFGGLRALVCATWLALYFGNGNDRLIGHPFLYDYLVALLLAAVALKKERPVVAGVLLAYAAMMRVFPGVMVVAAVICWCALDWRRLRAARRRLLRLVAGFGLTCSLLAVIGLGNGRGVDGWREFVSNMSHHRESHAVGTRRVGLAHLFTVDWSRLPAAYQTSSGRSRTWNRQKPAFYAAVAGVIGLWLWAIARSRLELSATVFSALVVVFALLVLSRYYWSSACLLMLIGGSPRDGPLGGRGPALMAAALFAWSAAVYGWWTFDREGLHHYLLANLLLAVLGVVGLIWLAWRGAARGGSGPTIESLSTESRPGPGR